MTPINFLLVAGALTTTFIFAIRSKYGLIPLGLIDLLVGLLLLGVEGTRVLMLGYAFEASLVFYLGFFLTVKGVYSLIMSVK